MSECVKCEKTYKDDMFPITKSKFFPKGHAPICFNCLEKMVDGTDIVAIDKFCQWVDYPLLVDDWVMLYRTNKDNTLRKYCAIVHGGTYQNLDWGDTNIKFKAALSRGEIEEVAEVLNQEWVDEMYVKWNLEAKPEEFRHLEYLYSDLLRTQNIITGTQIDNALKMCKLSWLADKEIRKGNVPKDLLKSYQDLAKASDFTPKNAKNAGDFDSCGELFLWLEKIGWRRKFHDFVDKDEVDATISNIQAYNKRLILGESSIKDDVGKRLEALQNFDINDVDDLEEVDENDDLAAISFLDEGDEEFEV